MQVFEVEQPLVGIVEPYSSMPITVRFQPVEKKAYSFTVPLQIVNSEGKYIMLEFSGNGTLSDSAASQSNVLVADMPSKSRTEGLLHRPPSLSPPQWLAALSHGVSTQRYTGRFNASVNTLRHILRCIPSTYILPLRDGSCVVVSFIKLTN